MSLPLFKGDDILKPVPLRSLTFRGAGRVLVTLRKQIPGPAGCPFSQRSFQMRSPTQTSDKSRKMIPQSVKLVLRRKGPPVIARRMSLASRLITSSDTENEYHSVLIVLDMKAKRVLLVLYSVTF